MAFEKSTVSVPKIFHRKERDKFYSNWTDAFWREMFQNSCDAGARNIRISLATAPRRGAFYEAADRDEDIIRVVFEDDGHGMDADVLKDVFFALGKSTKDGTTATGGFGRARILTHFSAARFGIQTNGNFVEGDGSDFHIADAETMREKMREARRDADEALFSTDGSVAPYERVISACDNDLALIDTLPATGCRMEIDLDPHEEANGEWLNRPTLEKMQASLDAYLQMSNVPATVVVNDESTTSKLSLKGMARTILTVEKDDGTEFEFAKAYWTRKKDAAFRNKMIVRVDGATMFCDEISADAQIVIEVDKAASRDILTSNRDGFKSVFNRAITKFRQNVVVDTSSALDDRSDAVHIIEGDKGLRRARREDLLSPPATGVEIALATQSFRTPAKATRLEGVDRIEQQGVDGIPFADLCHFLREGYYSNSVYDLLVSHDGALESCRNAARIFGSAAGTRPERVREAIEVMGSQAWGAIAAVLKHRLAERQVEAERKLAERLTDSNSIMVHVRGNPKGALRNAITRNDPKKWDPETGNGRKLRQILAAWDVYVTEAIRVIYQNHPDAAPEQMDWSSGFVYCTPSEEYTLGSYSEAHVTAAEYRLENDRHFFLINPVDASGKLNFNLSDTADLQRLAILAAHEVAHVHEKYHNEAFATLFTWLSIAMDLREANRRVNQVRKDIADLYSQKSVRMQVMDGQQGSRPAHRLFASQAPRAHMAYGSEGMGLDATRALTESAVEQLKDGTTRIDLERLELAEDAMRHGHQMSREGNIDNPDMSCNDETPQFRH